MRSRIVNISGSALPSVVANETGKPDNRLKTRFSGHQTVAATGLIEGSHENSCFDSVQAGSDATMRIQ